MNFAFFNLNNKIIDQLPSSKSVVKVKMGGFIPCFFEDRHKSLAHHDGWWLTCPSF